MLVGTKGFAKVFERGLGAGDHAVEVVFMTGVVVDLDGHIAPFILLHCIARRLVGKEIKDRHVHLVAEVAPPVFLPFFLQITGGNSDLVVLGADHRIKGDPVGIVGNVVALETFGIVAITHALFGEEAVLLAVLVARKLATLLITDHRKYAAAVHKGAVENYAGIRS